MRLFKAIFQMEMRNILAYRFSFWINFFGSTLGQLGLSYFLWSSIFGENKNLIIGGMSFQMMILYSFLAPMTLKSVFGLQNLNINQDIYDGSLNKYIIYPLSYFQFKNFWCFLPLILCLQKRSDIFCSARSKLLALLIQKGQVFLFNIKRNAR